ncbi:hypothetical protein BASA81_010012 [Batrachochytrium salamandrivorans]|nr:hypothetical protein BASA81_010012 [Batrachochytrium salamandrivorans]
MSRLELGDGSVYTGDLEGGVIPVGFGLLQSPAGDAFFGQFSSKFELKPPGVSVQGEEDLVAFGNQVGYYSSPTNAYLGEVDMKTLQQSGFGVSWFPDGAASLFAKFQSGIAVGCGVLIEQAGHEYFGELEHNLPHGHGCQFSPSGCFQGQFYRGQILGFGVFTNCETGVETSGEWDQARLVRLVDDHTGVVQIAQGQAVKQMRQASFQLEESVKPAVHRALQLAAQLHSQAARTRNGAITKRLANVTFPPFPMQRTSVLPASPITATTATPINGKTVAGASRGQYSPDMGGETQAESAQARRGEFVPEEVEVLKRSAKPQREIDLENAEFKKLQLEEARQQRRVLLRAESSAGDEHDEAPPLAAAAVVHHPVFDNSMEAEWIFLHGRAPNSVEMELMAEQKSTKFRRDNIAFHQRDTVVKDLHQDVGDLTPAANGSGNVGELTMERSKPVAVAVDLGFKEIAWQGSVVKGNHGTFLSNTESERHAPIAAPQVNAGALPKRAGGQGDDWESVPQTATATRRSYRPLDVNVDGDEVVVATAERFEAQSKQHESTGKLYSVAAMEQRFTVPVVPAVPVVPTVAVEETAGERFRASGGSRDLPASADLFTMRSKLGSEAAGEVSSLRVSQAGRNVRFDSDGDGQKTVVVGERRAGGGSAIEIESSFNVLRVRLVDDEGGEAFSQAHSRRSEPVEEKNESFSTQRRLAFAEEGGEETGGMYRGKLIPRSSSAPALQLSRRLYEVDDDDDAMLTISRRPRHESVAGGGDVFFSASQPRSSSSSAQVDNDSRSLQPVASDISLHLHRTGTNPTIGLIHAGDKENARDLEPTLKLHRPHQSDGGAFTLLESLPANNPSLSSYAAMDKLILSKTRDKTRLVRLGDNLPDGDDLVLLRSTQLARSNQQEDQENVLSLSRRSQNQEAVRLEPPYQPQDVSILRPRNEKETGDGEDALNRASVLLARRRQARQEDVDQPNHPSALPLRKLYQTDDGAGPSGVGEDGDLFRLQPPPHFDANLGEGGSLLLHRSSAQPLTAGDRFMPLAMDSNPNRVVLSGLESAHPNASIADSADPNAFSMLWSSGNGTSPSTLPSIPLAANRSVLGMGLDPQQTADVDLLGLNSSMFVNLGRTPNQAAPTMVEGSNAFTPLVMHETKANWKNYHASSQFDLLNAAPNSFTPLTTTSTGTVLSQTGVGPPQLNPKELKLLNAYDQREAQPNALNPLAMNSNMYDPLKPDLAAFTPLAINSTGAVPFQSRPNEIPPVALLGRIGDPSTHHLLGANSHVLTPLAMSSDAAALKDERGLTPLGENSTATRQLGMNPNTYHPLNGNLNANRMDSSLFGMNSSAYHALGVDSVATNELGADRSQFGINPSTTSRLETSSNTYYSLNANFNATSKLGMNPNATSELWMNSNATNELRMNPNAANELWMNPNAANELWMNPNATNELRMNPNATNELRMNSNATSELWMNSNATSELRMNPNATSELWMNPNATNELRMNPNATSKLGMNPSATNEPGMNPNATSQLRADSHMHTSPFTSLTMDPNAYGPQNASPNAFTPLATNSNAGYHYPLGTLSNATSQLGTNPNTVVPLAMNSDPGGTDSIRTVPLQMRTGVPPTTTMDSSTPLAQNDFNRMHTADETRSLNSNPSAFTPLERNFDPLSASPSGFGPLAMNSTGTAPLQRMAVIQRDSLIPSTAQPNSLTDPSTPLGMNSNGVVPLQRNSYLLGVTASPPQGTRLSGFTPLGMSPNAQDQFHQLGVNPNAPHLQGTKFTPLTNLNAYHQMHSRPLTTDVHAYDQLRVDSRSLGADNAYVQLGMDSHSMETDSRPLGMHPNAHDRLAPGSGSMGINDNAYHQFETNLSAYPVFGMNPDAHDQMGSRPLTMNPNAHDHLGMGSRPLGMDAQSETYLNGFTPLGMNLDAQNQLEAEFRLLGADSHPLRMDLNASRLPETNSNRFSPLEMNIDAQDQLGMGSRQLRVNPNAQDHLRTGSRLLDPNQPGTNLDGYTPLGMNINARDQLGMDPFISSNAPGNGKSVHQNSFAHLSMDDTRLDGRLNMARSHPSKASSSAALGYGALYPLEMNPVSGSNSHALMRAHDPLATTPLAMRLMAPRTATTGSALGATPNDFVSLSMNSAQGLDSNAFVPFAPLNVNGSVDSSLRPLNTSALRSGATPGLFTPLALEAQVPGMGFAPWRTSAQFGNEADWGTALGAPFLNPTAPFAGLNAHLVDPNGLSPAASLGWNASSARNGQLLGMGFTALGAENGNQHAPSGLTQPLSHSANRPVDLGFYGMQRDSLPNTDNSLLLFDTTNNDLAQQRAPHRQGHLAMHQSTLDMVAPQFGGLGKPGSAYLDSSAAASRPDLFSPLRLLSMDESMMGMPLNAGHFHGATPSSLLGPNHQSALQPLTLESDNAGGRYADLSLAVSRNHSHNGAREPRSSRNIADLTLGGQTRPVTTSPQRRVHFQDANDEGFAELELGDSTSLAQQRQQQRGGRRRLGDDGEGENLPFRELFGLSTGGGTPIKAAGRDDLRLDSTSPNPTGRQAHDPYSFRRSLDFADLDLAMEDEGGGRKEEGAGQLLSRQEHRERAKRLAAMSFDELEMFGNDLNNTILTPRATESSPYVSRLQLLRSRLGVDDGDVASLSPLLYAELKQSREEAAASDGSGLFGALHTFSDRLDSTSPPNPIHSAPLRTVSYSQLTLNGSVFQVLTLEEEEEEEVRIYQDIAKGVLWTDAQLGQVLGSNTNHHELDKRELRKKIIEWGEGLFTELNKAAVKEGPEPVAMVEAMNWSHVWLDNGEDGEDGDKEEQPKQGSEMSAKTTFEDVRMGGRLNKPLSQSLFETTQWGGEITPSSAIVLAGLLD